MKKLSIIIMILFIFCSFTIHLKAETSIEEKKFTSIADQVFTAYKNKDINLDNFTVQVDAIDGQCQMDSHFKSVSKGLTILISYYYVARLKFLDKLIYDFGYPSENDNLSFKDMLMGLSIPQIMQDFNYYLNELTYKEVREAQDVYKTLKEMFPSQKILKDFGVYLEQLNDKKANTTRDIYNAIKELRSYYDLFQKQATEKNINSLNSKKWLNKKDFYDLGFPSNINECFLRTLSFNGIHIAYYGTTYYSGLSLDGYFYTFWLRRYNEGTINTVKTILDFVLHSIKPYVKFEDEDIKLKQVSEKLWEIIPKYPDFAKLISDPLLAIYILNNLNSMSSAQIEQLYKMLVMVKEKNIRHLS